MYSVSRWALIVCTKDCSADEHTERGYDAIFNGLDIALAGEHMRDANDMPNPLGGKS
jgi:hypothetical protein